MDTGGLVWMFVSVSLGDSVSVTVERVTPVIPVLLLVLLVFSAVPVVIPLHRLLRSESRGDRGVREVVRVEEP